MPQIHLKRHSGDAKVSVTAGFTPGGHIPSGYSYLQRSHSLVTPFRRNVPKGMGSPTRLEKDSTNSPVSSPTSPGPLHRSDSTASLTDSLPSPRLARSHSDSSEEIATLVAQLPPNPKVWTPSQVALYLTHVLGLTPRPVVEDVTAYVRKSRMGGKVFLRLREKDLAAEGLNLKWRTLMIEAVKKLRRDCLRGRIWGFEGGLQLPRQDDDLLTNDAAESEEAEQKLHITAQGTLKRLRDQKGIRQMIHGFENPNPRRSEDSVSLDYFARDNHSQISLPSLSSLHEGDIVERSPRSPMAPIYGQGFVKSQAESFTSLSDLSTKHCRRDFSKEELEHLFGSLSDEEAEALANELLQDEELAIVLSFEEAQHSHHRSLSSLPSSTSSDIDLITPPCEDASKFAPINAGISEVMPFLESVDAAPVIQLLSEPTRGMLLKEDADDASQLTGLTHSRPGVAGRSNPYRSSTYMPEEMVALGKTIALDEERKFSTAKRMQHSPFIVNPIIVDESVDVEMPSEALSSANTIPTFISSDLDFEGLPPQHMRNMSAHEASGLSPYKPISQPMSRKSSQRRNDEASKERNIGTVSKGNEGINGLQLTAMLMASGLADGPYAEVESDPESKKAENESQWGITFSRKASRRGTLVRPSDQEVGTGTAAATRMAKLFAPADDNDTYQSGKAEDATSSQLKVPAEGADAGSMRKRSMILVERKKFESLARRMGLLETQLADMASATLPPSSDLYQMQAEEDGRNSSTQALKPSSIADVASTNDRRSRSANDEMANRGWNIARLISAVPSYAVGLGAGIGFVLFNELLGKSRR